MQSAAVGGRSNLGRRLPSLSFHRRADSRLPPRFSYEGHVVWLDRPGSGQFLFMERVTRVDHDFSAETPQPPVIMSSPLACNGLFYLMTPGGKIRPPDSDNTFATFLANRGLDVFVIHPPYSSKVLDPLVREVPDLPRNSNRSVSLRTLAEHHSIMALEYVRQVTGADQVNWVGLSMGGTVGLGIVGLSPKSPIGKLVPIGSPMEFGDSFLSIFYAFKQGIRLKLASAMLSPAVSAAGGLVEPAAAVLSRAMRVTSFVSGVMGFVYHRPNMNPRAIAALLRSVVENPGAPLLKSFADWIFKGEYPFIESLARIRTPTLFIYGEEDRIATPTGVGRLRDAMVSAQRMGMVEELAVAGAGHVDMVVGYKAREQVWEPTHAFLTRP